MGSSVEFMGGKQVYTRKINDIVKAFLVQKIQGNQEIIRSRQGSLSSESYISLIQENIKYEEVYFKNQWEKLRNQFAKTIVLPPYQIELRFRISDIELKKKDMKLHCPVVKIKQSTPMNPRAQ